MYYILLKNIYLTIFFSNDTLNYNKNFEGCRILRFAIVDDDIFFADNLKRNIMLLCEKNQFDVKIKCFNEANLILEEDQFVKYDIIFLDIEMPQINGIDIADRINRLRGENLIPYIVFVTSKEHLVFDALKKLPYSFIRKSQISDIEPCLSSLCKRLSISPTYSIKDGRGIRAIEIKSIIRVDKQRNYTIFHTKNEIYAERSCIDDKYKDLAQYHFLRPHIGALVNIIHIKECKKDDIIMSDGSIISVSRSYKKTFKEELHKWMMR